MSKVLITGASGFVGSRLLARLAGDHDVVVLSRRPRTVDIVAERERGAGDGPAYATVRADFSSREELQALDEHEIDVVVHLASEIGECSEQAGLAVNVLGTRTLMRYLIDRGCKRFVVASSIAAVGSSSEDFVPRALPIPDDHPCDAVDPYGLSKGLMEDVAFYFARQNEELEVTLFRLGAVLGGELTEESTPDLADSELPYIIAGGMVDAGDTVEAFARAVERPAGPGARRVNLVDGSSMTSAPVPEALARALGERAAELDLSYFESAGRERASLYSTDRLTELYDLGTRRR